jgi:hypothetical protein
MELELRWEQHDSNRPRYYGSPWFDRAKLEQLGYDCRVPIDDPEAAQFYAHATSRKAYAVLEYEGPAWKAVLADKEQEVARMPDLVHRKERTLKELEEAKKDLQRLRTSGSRLVLVDVGRDADRLRENYPDAHRYLIAPAIVALMHFRAWTEKDGKFHPAYLNGRVQKLMVEEIHVPLEYRPLLNRLLEDDQRRSRESQEPRYRVSLRYGQRLEPWLEEVQPLGIAQ